MIGRRAVVTGMAAVAAVPVVAKPARQGPRIGVQLYMARELMARDFDGTLAAIAGTGVRDVEFAGFHDRSAAAVRASLSAAGLRAIGAHALRADMKDDEIARIIATCAEIGMEYAIAAVPLVPALKLPITSKEQVRAALDQLTVDDIARTADRFNAIAAKVKAAGMRFAYHTHGLDFRRYGARYGFDEMVARCDPRLVSFELDVGNTFSAGADPLPYFARLGARLPLAHLKDWRGPYEARTWDVPPSAPIGRGTIDYAAVMRAMRRGRVAYAFIEQEQTPADQVIATIADSYAFLSKL